MILDRESHGMFFKGDFSNILDDDVRGPLRGLGLRKEAPDRSLQREILVEEIFAFRDCPKASDAALRSHLRWRY
jgi:hypothetical protein